MTTRQTLTRLLAPALVAAAAIAAPAARAADVGVSIGFSQPGVYGRVNIGSYPAPVLYAPQPVIVGRPVYREPVYMWVPPAHRADWRHNCYRYRACGAPVYFVHDNWYRDHVRYDRGYDRGHHYGRDRNHDGWHDDRDHHGRGHDRDHGHGHR